MWRSHTAMRRRRSSCSRYSPAWSSSRSGDAGTAGSGEPSVSKDDGTVIVTATRQIPVDKVPRMARHYLGDGQLTQTDRWGASATRA